MNKHLFISSSHSVVLDYLSSFIALSPLISFNVLNIYVLGTIYYCGSALWVLVVLLSHWGCIGEDGMNVFILTHFSLFQIQRMPF